MPLDICERIEDLRSRLLGPRRAAARIGLVPTMGALHAGHRELIERARDENDVVVVSIFVNAAQFEDASDFSNYPRTDEDDRRLCEEAGVDVIFRPAHEDMYPRPPATSVAVEPLGSDLIGAVRPGHFTGVATVVAKLFNIVMPQRAYFGEKDFQQLAIIRRMVDDLSIPVTIVPVPTVRDEDGLALSSRNRRLDLIDRSASTVIHRALRQGAKAIEDGEARPDIVLRMMRETIEGEPRARLRSLDIRDANSLEPVERIGNTPVVLLVTAQFGSVLLIDQQVALPPRANDETIAS